MNPSNARAVPSSIAPATLPAGRAVFAGSHERVDMYATPHRALRYMLSNLLVAFGRTTFADPVEAGTVVAGLTVVLWACEGHIAHEDHHLRPILARRAVNATATLDDEHGEHGQQVAELRAIASSLRDASTPEARTAMGHMLYLRFSVFVAETLAHMAYEERVVQPLLDRLCTADELRSVEDAIVRSIPPLDMIVWLRAMVPASDRETRAKLLEKVRAEAPRDVFQSFLSEVRLLLREEDRADLAERLGV